MIINGNVMDKLKDLQNESVNCVVTSPPYWGLRDYGNDDQIGLESDPQEYIEKMVAVFREIKRILKNDGTLWINIGDSYSGSGKGTAGNLGKKHNERHLEHKTGGLVPSGTKPKDLVGIPWMLAFALRADGWYLRQDIIWAKPNPMPESVQDRCTKSHEYLFMLSKSPKYYFDNNSIREKAVTGSWDKLPPIGGKKHQENGNPTYSGNQPSNDGLRNKRDVWTIPTKPFKDAHFAVMPEALVQPCILAGCPEGGTVLDPFFGSGTVGVVANNLGRKWIGIELNSDYVEIAKKRLGLFCEVVI